MVIIKNQEIFRKYLNELISPKYNITDKQIEELLKKHPELHERCDYSLMVTYMIEYNMNIISYERVISLKGIDRYNFEKQFDGISIMSINIIRDKEYFNYVNNLFGTNINMKDITSLIFEYNSNTIVNICHQNGCKIYEEKFPFKFPITPLPIRNACYNNLGININNNDLSVKFLIRIKKILDKKANTFDGVIVPKYNLRLCLGSIS